MLTYIRTPRLLIPHLFEPETYGPDGRELASVRYRAVVEIDAEEEAALPGYIKAKASNAEWYGVAKGTRYIALSCGQPPMIFGLPVGISQRAKEHNVPMDRLLVNQPARLAVSSFTRKTSRGGYRGNPASGDETWPVLRAVEMLGVNDVTSFDAYAEANRQYWETRE